jgi:hypothetical protein
MQMRRAVLRQIKAIGYFFYKRNPIFICSNECFFNIIITKRAFGIFHLISDSIQTFYSRHGQAAARQRFFAALAAEFNDVSGHNLVMNHLKLRYLRFNMRKNIRKNFVAALSAIYLLKIGPRTKKVACSIALVLNIQNMNIILKLGPY